MHCSQSSHVLLRLLGHPSSIGLAAHQHRGSQRALAAPSAGRPVCWAQHGACSSAQHCRQSAAVSPRHARPAICANAERARAAGVGCKARWCTAVMQQPLVTVGAPQQAEVTQTRWCLEQRTAFQRYAAGSALHTSAAAQGQVWRTPPRSPCSRISQTWQPGHKTRRLIAIRPTQRDSPVVGQHVGVESQSWHPTREVDFPPSLEAPALNWAKRRRAEQDTVRTVLLW